VLALSHARRSAWSQAFDSARAAATAMLVKGKCATSGSISKGIRVTFRASSLSLTAEARCVSVSGTKNQMGAGARAPAKVRMLSASSRAFVSDDLRWKTIDAKISRSCVSDLSTDMIDPRIYESYSIFCLLRSHRLNATRVSLSGCGTISRCALEL